MGADIWAVNPASVATHDNYCSQKGYTFPLLSDTGKTVARAYEAVFMGGAVVQRTVYVIGPGRKIIFAEQGMPADQKMIDAITQDK